MVENSTAGLVMVSGEVAVTVTREEQHQDVLARYTPSPGGERSVAVELTWCVVSSGKYEGRHAIEVRLDKRRVGELTHLMSQRYEPLVTRVYDRGGRPGCAAVVTRDARGLQLTLRLPRDAAAIPAHAAEPPTVEVPAIPRPPVPTQVPVAHRGKGAFTRHRTAWTVAAAVVAVLVVAGLVSNGENSPSTVADETTTDFSVPTATSTTRSTAANTATSTTTTTTTPPPPPATTTTTTVALPPPPPPQPTVTQPPVAEAPPQRQCDPNYTGCVPVAPDVDCAGGTGNGPAYVDGPVDVIGSDIYDLDNDSDGTACE